MLALTVALRHQAAVARRRIGKPWGERAPDADRIWRRRLGGELVQLLMLGDSIAAGLGADHRKNTLGGRIAKQLALALQQPVQLHTAAVVGAESSSLREQLDALPPGYLPDIAVIIVGGNDVTHRIPVTESVRHLDEAVRRLRALGADVVVGTCPDLGALRPVPQPLRAIAGRMSWQLAAAQAAAAEVAGGRAVSLRHAVGADFSSDPDAMFSLDRFHPSARGYRRVADAIMPVVLASLSEQNQNT